MPQRTKGFKLEFYHPVSGELRATFEENVGRVLIQENTRGSADDAEFHFLHDYEDLSDFLAGDEVKVHILHDNDDDDLIPRHIWTGVVDATKSQRDGPTRADMPLKAQDWVYHKLKTRYITDVWEDQTAGEIVRSAVSQTASEIDVSQVEDTDVTFARFVARDESLLSLLNRLGDEANAEFHGDKDKRLHFFPKKTKSSGMTIGPDSVVRGSFAVEESLQGFGNSVLVRGAEREVIDQRNGNQPDSFIEVDGDGVYAKANLVRNGSFEEGVTGWTHDVDNGVVEIIEETGAPEGDSILRCIRDEGGSGNCKSVSGDISVTAGEIHTLSAWSRLFSVANDVSDAKSSVMKVKCYDSGGGLIGIFSDGFRTLQDSKSWERKHITFTTPPNTDHVAVEVGFVDNGSTTGEVWFDAVKLETGPVSAWGPHDDDTEDAPAELLMVKIPISKSKLSSIDLWTRPDPPQGITLEGPISVRIQPDFGGGVEPVRPNDSSFDLASKIIEKDDLAQGDFTTFVLGDHDLSSEVVWVIIESGDERQYLGVVGNDIPLYQTRVQHPVVTRRQSTRSVKRHGRVELQPLTDTTIRTSDDADLIARALLKEARDPSKTGSFEALDMDLVDVVVGETVEASFPKDKIPEGTDLSVVGKKHEYDGDEYHLTIDFTDSRIDFTAADILAALARRIKRLEDAELGEDVSLAVAMGELVGFTSNLTVEETASGNHLVGTARVGFSTLWEDGVTRTFSEIVEFLSDLLVEEDPSNEVDTARVGFCIVE